MVPTDVNKIFWIQNRIEIISVRNRLTVPYPTRIPVHNVMKIIDTRVSIHS